MLVAAANDLAYVVQAVVSSSTSSKHSMSKVNASQAPNFVWKTTDFPAAKKGFLWSIILQILLGEAP